MRYVACRTRPIIYLAIAKAGLTSTLNAMLWLDAGRHADDPDDIHRLAKTAFVSADTAPEELERRLKTDKVFVIVREPLERAFSLFNEKAVHEHAHAFPFLRRRLLRRGARLDPEAGLERMREDFLLFLKCVRSDMRKARELGRYGGVNPHWRPQHVTLRQAARIRFPDFICRTETLSRDFPAFLRWAGIEDLPPARRFNQGPPPPYPAAEVLDDPRVTEMARRLFASDYRRLGYPLPGGG